MYALDPQAGLEKITGGFLSSRGFLFREFCPGFCLEGFVRPSPVIIHLLQQKAKNTLHFRFHMYEICLKCDVTCPWTPSPCYILPHLPEHLPLERDVLYERPP